MPTGSPPLHAKEPFMSAITHVVLVGHCVPDSALLRGLVKRLAPEVEVTRANSLQELAAHTKPQALWLVNRVLDGSFPHNSGAELIRDHASRPSGGTPVLML